MTGLRAVKLASISLALGVVHAFKLVKNISEGSQTPQPWALMYNMSNDHVSGTQ